MSLWLDRCAIRSISSLFKNMLINIQSVYIQMFVVVLPATVTVVFAVIAPVSVSMSISCPAEHFMGALLQVPLYVCVDTYVYHRKASTLGTDRKL